MTKLMNIGIEMCYMLVLGLPIMLMWNDVIHKVFNLAKLTYPNTLQIMILLYCVKLSMEPALGKNAKLNKVGLVKDSE